MSMTKIGFIFEIAGSDKSVKDLVAAEAALGGIRDTSRSVKKQLRDVEKAMRDTGKSKKEIEALRKKHVQLNETLVDFKKKEIEASNESKKFRKEIREQVREFDRAKYPVDSLEGLSDQYSKLRLQIRQLSREERRSPFGAKLIKDAKKLKDEVREVSESFGDTTGSVGSYQTAIENSLRGNGSFIGNFKSLGKNLLSVALPLAAVVKGVQLVGKAINSAVNIVLNYQQANADLASILGTSRQKTDELQKVQQAYGASTAFSATQVAELQTELAKLGFSTEEITSATSGVINFAIATGADVPRAAALAGSALRAFALDASEFDRVVSVLGVSTTKSALDFSKLETALSTVAPVANAFGFSIEETVALLGTLSDAGFDATSAGTATRNILLNLADSSGALAQELGGAITSFDDFIPALVELRDKGVDLNTTLELTDKRSVAAFNQFLQTAEGATKLRDSITDVNDELDAMSREKLNTVKGQLTLLNSAWEGLVLSIDDGDGIISGVFQSVLGAATDTLTVFRQLIETSPADAYRAQKVELEGLLTALVNNNDNNEVRNVLINDLNQKYSEYLGNLDLENIKLSDINKTLGVYDRINKSKIEDLIKEEKINELYADREELIKNIIDVEKTNAANDGGFFSGSIKAGEFAIKRYRKELDEVVGQIADLEKEPGRINRGGGLGGLVKSTEEDSKEIIVTLETLKAEKAALEKALETTDIASGSFTIIKKRIKALSDQIEAADISKKIKKIEKAFTDGSLADLQQELTALTTQLNEGETGKNTVAEQLQLIIDKKQEIEDLKATYDELERRLSGSDIIKLVVEIDALADKELDDFLQKLDDAIERPDFEPIDDQGLIDFAKKTEAEKKAAEKRFRDYENILAKNAEKARSKEEKEELKRVKELEKQKAEIKQQFLRVAEDLTGAIFDIQRSKIDEETEAELDAVNSRYEQKIAAAEGNVEEQERLEEELVKKREAIEKKAAKKRQGIAVKEALINGALAVVEALPNVAAAVAAAAATAIQIAVIKSQKFASGGFTGRASGQRDETGQVPVGIVHANEYVANRHDTDEFRDFFLWLESRKGGGGFKKSSFKFADGGFADTAGNFTPQVISVNQFVQPFVTLSDEQIDRLAEAVVQSNKKLPSAVGNATKQAILEGGEEKSRIAERKKFSEAKNEF